MTPQAITRAQGMPSTCGQNRRCQRERVARRLRRGPRARAISAVSLSKVIGSVNTYTGRVA